MKVGLVEKGFEISDLKFETQAGLGGDRSGSSISAWCATVGEFARSAGTCRIRARLLVFRAAPGMGEPQWARARDAETSFLDCAGDFRSALGSAEPRLMSALEGIGQIAMSGGCHTPVRACLHLGCVVERRCGSVAFGRRCAAFLLVSFEMPPQGALTMTHSETGVQSVSSRVMLPSFRSSGIRTVRSVVSGARYLLGNEAASLSLGGA